MKNKRQLAQFLIDKVDDGFPRSQDVILDWLIEFEEIMESRKNTEARHVSNIEFTGSDVGAIVDACRSMVKAFSGIKICKPNIPTPACEHEWNISSLVNMLPDGTRLEYCANCGQVKVNG